MTGISKGSCFGFRGTGGGYGYPFFVMRQFLPPTNVVCEGYVFTGVCLSMGGSQSQQGGSPSGGFSIRGGGGSPSRGVFIQGGSPSRGVSIWGGSSSGGFSIWGVLHPGGRVLHQGGFSIWGGLHQVNVRAVHILLECILVS